LRGRQGGTFMVGLQRHLASLRHCKYTKLKEYTILICRADLSRRDRCSCIGPRAILFGQIIHFCQIHPALENSVE